MGSAPALHSEVWGVDIHPGARVGNGVMLDHASGVVIGGTAEVGSDGELRVQPPVLVVVMVVVMVSLPPVPLVAPMVR